MTDMLIERIESQIKAFDTETEESLQVSYTVASKTALYRAGKLDGMCSMLSDAGVPEDKANEIRKKVCAVESKWLHQLNDRYNADKVSELEKRIESKKEIAEEHNAARVSAKSKERGKQHGE